MRLDTAGHGIGGVLSVCSATQLPLLFGSYGHKESDIVCMKPGGHASEGGLLGVIVDGILD